jgi:hypothetical protein
MMVEPLGDGVRLSVTTAGVTVLARFVVGLGDAARAETPELLAEVTRIAQASLRAHAQLARGATARAKAGAGAQTA